MDFTVFGSFSQFLLAGVIIFFGQLIYAAIGFGSGMFTVTLLSLLTGNVSVVIPYFLLLCISTEFYVVATNREKLNFSLLKRFLIFLFAGLLIGSLMLKNAPDNRLLFYLGIVVITVAIYFLFFEERLDFSFREGGKTGMGAAFWAGILGGVYGISGPPIIVYLKGLKLDKQTFRTTILSVFFAMSVLRTFIYAFLGLYNFKLLLTAVVSLPFVFAGIYAGNKLHFAVPEKEFKIITSIVLLLSGIMLALKYS